MTIFLIGILPYNYIMIYYFYTSFSVYFWAVIGILALIYAEHSAKWYKVLGVSVILFLILGSYPPIISMLLVLFMAKRLCDFIDNKQNFRAIVKDCFVFAVELFIAGMLFKITMFLLEKNNFLNSSMYNLQLVSFNQIFQNVFLEILKSLKCIFSIKSILGWQYVCFFAFLIFSAVLFVLFKGKNKFIALILLLGIFIASRFSFIVSSNSYIAEYRVQYWGILGITIFSFAMLLKMNTLWKKNLFYVLGVIFVCLFIKTGFDAQKTMVSIFKSELRLHNTMFDRISSHPKFDSSKSYYSMNFGYPLSWKHFCKEGCKNFNNESLSAVVLPFDLIPTLFWDRGYNPIYLKSGIMGNSLWFVFNREFLYDRISNKDMYISDSNIDEIRKWLYMDAKMYPHKDSLYIDDKNIIFVMNGLDFYKYREKFISHLKEKKAPN